MPRVKRGTMTHKRHRKILEMAKGYRGKRKNVFKLAKVAVIKAGVNAYRGRKEKKRVYRRLWISRLSAALRARGYMYSRFIDQQTKKNIIIDRKILSNLAATDEKIFDKIVKNIME
jgi:large subunit ribosomal protein L20